MLTEEEIKKLEEIYNDKFKYVYESFYKSKGRYCTDIRFSNNQKIGRLTAAWRLEAKLGRKLNTFRTGGNETCDHIDNNKLNDHPNNLQLLTNNENVKKQNIYNPIYGEKCLSSKLTENDVINILKYYYIDKMNMYDIVKLYPNVEKKSIYRVINRNTWKHILFEIPDNLVRVEGVRNKLTEQDVILIKLKNKFLNSTPNELSEEFNIHPRTITDIFNNKSWKHIKIPDLYDFFIGNKHIIAIPNQIIIINNIEYEFLGKINIIPNINCIYINNDNKVIKRTIKK